MGARTVPADDALEVELAALRARAYGIGDGLDGDPAALERLTQLEEWHAIARRDQPLSDIPDDPGVDAREFERMAAAADPMPAALEGDRLSRFRSWLGTSRVRSVALSVGAAAAALLVAAGLYLWASPRPDAVLRLTDRPPDSQAITLAGYARNLLVDNATLESYEPFRGIEVYSARSALGNRCLLAMEPSTDSLLGATCVPSGADPVVYIYDVPIFGTGEWHEGLPTGSVVRFVLLGGAVTAWVYEGGGQADRRVDFHRW